jgi:hypothetical protein
MEPSSRLLQAQRVSADGPPSSHAHQAPSAPENGTRNTIADNPRRAKFAQFAIAASDFFRRLLRVLRRD